MFRHIVLVLIGATFAVGNQLSSQAAIVQNGSFEDPAIPDGRNFLQFDPGESIGGAWIVEGSVTILSFRSGALGGPITNDGNQAVRSRNRSRSVVSLTAYVTPTIRFCPKRKTSTEGTKITQDAFHQSANSQPTKFQLPLNHDSSNTSWPCKHSEPSHSEMVPI